MKYLNKKWIKYILLILSFLLISYISVFFFINTHILYSNYDMQFHISRIMELKHTLSHGMLFSNFSFNYFHGSAVMSMYPYISIIPFVLILFFTHSIIYSYYLFFSIFIFTTLVISFFCCMNYKRNIYVSYLFSLAYSLSPLLTFEDIANGDLGVFTSLAFLPLVIFGFLNLLREYKYRELVIGLVMMSYCQITAVIIILAFLIFWTILNYKKFTKKMFFIYIKVLVLFILLTTIIWIPIVNISYSNVLHTVTIAHLTGLTKVFFLEGTGPCAIISIIVSVIMFTKLDIKEKQMFLLSVFILIISSKLIPWHFITSLPVFNLLNVFQFTFRFMFIPLILLCYLFAVEVVKICGKKFRCKLFYILIIFMIIMSQISFQIFIIHKRSSIQQVYINNYRIEREYELDQIPNSEAIFKNNKSIKYFIDGYSQNKDYYPRSSLSKLSYIRNNEGKCGISKIHVKRIGYNEFYFYNRRFAKRFSLPLLEYNNEHINTYINGRKMHHYTSNNHLIIIKNISEGPHKLIIKYFPNVKLILLELILFILGIILIFK